MMLMTLEQIRDRLDGAWESVICNYDESDPASNVVRLSLDEARNISQSLVRYERILRVLMEGV